MYQMELKEFIEKLELAVNSKTLYVNGAFGAPATPKNKTRYANLSSNAKRKDAINSASADTFFFDCAGVVKGVLWGWNASTDKVYGGAIYGSNGVPDHNEMMINDCYDVSTDMTNIDVGEFMYMSGHCGVYVGGGKVIECTPAWKNGVQITLLSQRKWLRHGKLPWVKYVETPQPKVDIVVPQPTLRYGNSGDRVKQLQHCLNQFGYNLKEDGAFGGLTKSALMNWQKKNKDVNGTALDVDGIYGKKSYGAMKKALNIV